MSEMSEKARAAMKAKAERMGGSGDPHQKVDASSWTPPPAMETQAQTGPRPVSKRRNYKSGGVVAGAEAKHHAGRKPRKGGGKALVDDWVNSDVKEANEDREGIKHEGGMKRGGRSKRAGGGMAMLGPLSGLIPLAIASMSDKDDGKPAPYSPGTPGVSAAGGGKKAGGRTERAAGGEVPTTRFQFQNGPSMMTKAAGLKDGGGVKGHPDGCKCDRCAGGRVGRASGGALYKSQFSNEDGGRQPRKNGGSTKGKMSVNIVIAPGHAQPPPMAGGPPPGGPMPPPMFPPKPPMPPPGMAGPPPGMPPGIGAPPPMMPRKRGGRTEAGAGSGLGRLEKVKAYGANAKRLDGHY